MKIFIKALVLGALTLTLVVNDAKNEDQGHRPLKKICNAVGTSLTVTLPEDFNSSHCSLTINETDVFSCRNGRPVFGLPSAKERITVFCHNNTAVILAVQQVDEGSYASCNHTGSCIDLLYLEVEPDVQSCGDQTGTDPPSSPTGGNNTTNVTEPSIIKDGKTKIIIGSVAGTITIVLVTVVIIIIIYYCYRKNCARQAQRPDQENAFEMVPLDSPRDQTIVLQAEEKRLLHS